MSLKTLLICSFTLLVILSTFEIECYAKSSTIMGSRYQVIDWEKQTDEQFTDYLYNCSAESDYTSFNWYGASTTDTHIFDAAEGVSHTDSMSFYIGHGNVRPVWVVEYHWDIITDDGNWVADDWIYPYSSCQNVKLAFLWACHSGDVIGGTHFWSGPYGMPHAWLHTTDLSEDGYANPDNNGYVFLGFYDNAPGLTLTIGSKITAGYFFAGYFYQYALLDGKSIIQGLDWAARKTWNPTNGSYLFSDSPLYNGYYDGEDFMQMKVYGDGNLEIGSACSTPSLPSPPSAPRPPGHGCPSLFIWNGSSLDYETILDIHADSDITVRYRISQKLTKDGHTYKLRLWELDNHTSHIDLVRLYIVDKRGHWRISLLKTAIHNEFGDITRELGQDDSKRIDLSPSEIIDLEFRRKIPDWGISYFVFEINGYNYKPRPT